MKRTSYWSLPILLLAVLSSCIDKNYDLSDIDTTTEIKVTDLVIPINLDEVTLGDIISIKEGSELRKVTINGETFYAVDKSGEFFSEKIHIAEFQAPAPVVTSSVISYTGLPSTGGIDVKFPLNQIAETTVDYEASDIDASIVSISALFIKPVVIDIRFSSADYSHMDFVSLTDLNIDFLKGLIVDADASGNVIYEPDSGQLNIKKLQFGKDGTVTVTLPVNGIKNLERAFNANHELSIKEQIVVNKADINIKSAQGLPSNISITIDYIFPEFDFIGFSGVVKYDLEGISIAPVVLNSLPDFLAGEETNLVLANPQIYLSLNNPMASYNLSFQTGISITPIHDYDAGPEASLMLDKGFFEVSAAGGTQNFVLSPEKPSNIPADFEQNISWEPFTALSSVVEGPGIPKELTLDIVNPRVPEQKVDHFMLNTDLDGVVGKWEFLAPLAMKEGADSKIVYADRKTGWNDEDVDAIKISKLVLTMTVDNNLPLNAVLSGSPLGLDGNAIPGVSIKPVDLKANTTGQEVELSVKGTVTHLDGFEFAATVTSSSGVVLSPSQTLKLHNIRCRVSGSYIKKL